MNGVTREGYTFQTVLGSMGLNHMTGRVQDAITGRFLSPDPTIPNPANTQSYNRYTYVSNNPLTYTDPSGFEEVMLPINSVTDQSVSLDSPPLSEITVGGQRYTEFSTGTAGVTEVPGGGSNTGGSGDGEGIPEITVTGQKDPPVKSNVPPSMLPFYPGFGQPGFGLLDGLDPTGQKAMKLIADVLCQNSVREAVAGAAAGMAAAAVISKGNPYAILAGGAFGSFLGAIGSKNNAMLSAVGGAALGIFDPLAEGMTLTFGPAINGGAANFLGTASGGGTLGAAATAGATGAGSFLLSGAGSLVSGAGIASVALPAAAAGAAYYAVSQAQSAACNGQ
jgi:RHS repeat-associated protein